MKHHIWCNSWNMPAETCTQCKSLRERYPDEILSPEELMEKYFQDAIIKPGTEDKDQT